MTSDVRTRRIPLFNARPWQGLRRYGADAASDVDGRDRRGGHNDLLAATLSGRGGRSVRVLERRERIGSGGVSERASSRGHALARPTAARSLPVNADAWPSLLRTTPTADLRSFRQWSHCTFGMSLVTATPISPVPRRGDSGAGHPPEDADPL
jgi:hypothetical protein